MLSVLSTMSDLDPVHADLYADARRRVRAARSAGVEVAEDLPVALEWADTEAMKEGQRLIGLGYPVPGTDFSATPGTLVSWRKCACSASERSAAVDESSSLPQGPMTGPDLPVRYGTG